MRRPRAIAAIDIGTSKVAVIVADVGERGETRVLGYGVAPASGLTRGIVDNITSAREAIGAAVEKAEQSSGMRILSAVVGISGSHIESQNNRGIIAIADRTRPISEDDRARALDVAAQVSIPTNRTVLHVLPRGYWLEGADRVSDPAGMFATRLDAETHIVTAAISAVQNHAKCVEAAGVEVDELILESIASATAVLDPQERRQGVAAIDIGAGTTSMAVFDEGAIAHTAVFPIAGNHLTQDLASVLRCPWDSAEQLKREHGSALVTPEAAGTRVEVEAFGTQRTKEVALGYVSEIVRARCEEILEMAVTELRRSGYYEKVAAGLVLCGGTSELPGLALLGEERLGIPVRVGTPRDHNGISELIGSPAYATGVGLAEYSLRGREPAAEPVRLGPSFDGAGAGFMGRMKAAMRALIP